MAASQYSRGWGLGGVYASTSALDRLGRISFRLPGRHFEPSGRSDLGSRKPISVLQSQPIFRIARGRVQRRARRPIGAVAGRYRIAGKNRAGCPADLATGAGTGFTLVTDHIPEFARRGLCARDPKRALADSIAMRMPRMPANGDAFKPYSPAATLPYAHRWRLFRTPNDAFLAANTHREGTPLLDILQPAYAGLYSGAVHPTAEACHRRRPRRAPRPDHLGPARCAARGAREQGAVAVSGRRAYMPRNYSRASLETGSPGSSRLNNSGASATRSMMHSSCPLTSTLDAASIVLS